MTRRLSLVALWLVAACSSRDPGGRANPGPERPHALVVGGTGMLREVSLDLARRGHTTSVIARGHSGLDELVEASGGLVNPIALDYRDGDRLARELERAIATHGPIVVVVAWIHGSAPEAPRIVARTAAAGGHTVLYVHVLGSAADDPSRPDDARRSRFEAIPGLTYREVILGFVREGDDSRWLTDDEISAGVLAAIDSDAPRSIVGTTRPWSAHP